MPLRSWLAFFISCGGHLHPFHFVPCILNGLLQLLLINVHTRTGGKLQCPFFQVYLHLVNRGSKIQAAHGRFNVIRSKLSHETRYLYLHSLLFCCLRHKGLKQTQQEKQKREKPYDYFLSLHG